MTESNLFPELGRGVDESDILAEIERVISLGSTPAGQAARDYYSPGRLPELLNIYFLERGVDRRGKQASTLGVSIPTLTRIYDGADISENMLFRFQIAVRRMQLRVDAANDDSDQLLTRPWRDARGIEIQSVIADLVENISALIVAVEQSNSLNAEPNGISDLHRAQILSILRQALAQFEAPVINAREASTTLRRLSTAFHKGAASAVEERTKGLVSTTIEKGQRAVGELVKRAGWETFNNIL